MKKLLTLILLSGTILNATACSKLNVVEDSEKVALQQEMFERHKLSEDYSILVDKETGVCYLEHHFDRGCGITVLLNEDGTPKIWEDWHGGKLIPQI